MFSEFSIVLIALRTVSCSTNNELVVHLPPIEHNYSAADQKTFEKILRIVNCRSCSLNPPSFEVPITDLGNHSILAASSEIKGPETIEINNGKLYAGSSDGFIYEIDLQSNSTRPLTSACDVVNVTECHPGGFRLTKSGQLYFADAAGLFVYNFEQKTVELLVPTLTVVDGEPIMTLNDLDVDEENGIVYVSNPSTQYNNSRILRTTFTQQLDGRVLSYNIETKELKVIVKHLSFPNGVQLTHDKEYLLVCEFNKQRILKVNLGESTRGKFTVFTKNTEGSPDNVRLASDGGYWIGLNLGGNRPQFYGGFSTNELMGKKMLALNDLVGEYLAMLARWTGREWFQESADELLSAHFMSEVDKGTGIFLKVGPKGEIVRKYAVPNYGFITTVAENGDDLFCGNDRMVGILKIENFNTVDNN